MQASGSPAKKARTESAFPLFDLPEEMSLYIMTFLTAADMGAIASASKDLKRFASENRLWRKLCKRHSWIVPRSIQMASDFFDFKKFYSERASLSNPNVLTWTKSPKIGVAPSKRFKHSSTVVGKYLVIIGGQETDVKRFNDIIYFDTETNTFTQPIIRGDKVPNFSRHSATLVGSKIYIYGGFDGFGTNFDLNIFDPFSRTWTNVPNTVVRGQIPTSRTNHAAVAVGNKMYMFGGNNNNAAGMYQVLDDLCVLNTDTLTWSKPQTTGDRPTARSGHTLTAIGKHLYLFGGGVWNEEEGWVHKYNDLYVLNTETMVWTKPVCSGTIDTSTFPISYAIGRFLFVFGGGSKPQHCVTNDLYVLDTLTFSWSRPCTSVVGPAEAPAARDMGTASYCGRKVYFVGGYAGGAVEYFDCLSLGKTCTI